MACKRITAKTPAGKLNFDAEQRALKQFKSCITDNKNIMQSFASFIHGSDFIILSLWATGRDLSLFLTRPDEILDNYMARSIRFTPDNLLTEAYNLACALKFLHWELFTTRGKMLRCAHLDLKPENVLVSFLPEDRASEAPVGRWKISDFGLSKVEEAVTGDRVLPIGRDEQDASTAPGNIARELSFQPPTRGPGPFQPPEVQSTETAKVSTRRDVWSYGCILAMVLAFALGGSLEVENQKRRRVVGGDDYFYRRMNRRSRTSGPSPETMAHNVDAELKPPLRKWLEQAPKLADEIHVQWIHYTSNLILSLLDVNIISRPEIFLAVENLKLVMGTTERVATRRLWGFDGSSRLSQPVVIPPPEMPPGAEGVETTFVGVKDSSPPSSASYTAPRQRSPRHGSQRSSVGSSSIFFNIDSSLSFATLGAPDRCEGAFIEPLGHTAALWSRGDIRLYVLSSLHSDSAMWSERPTSTHAGLEPASCESLLLSETSRCLKVQLAGQWIALLEQTAPSAFCIRLYYRLGLRQAKNEFRSKFSYNRPPEDFKVSAQGALAIRFRERVDLHTTDGSTKVALEKEFGAMTFSVNGQFFCLWERDRREKGHTKPAWNFWSVWSHNTNPASPEFTMLGDTISVQLPRYAPDKTTGEVLLMPFTTYPRFIACDRQQYVYLVRADVQSARAHILGRTDNAKAGFVLPDDENFMLVRGSQHDTQRAEKCFMSFMGSPSLQPRSCGKLYENIDAEADGVAVVPFDQLEGSPCLLTLRQSGRLVRKVL
jgi:serine/threonine protein kinase